MEKRNSLILDIDGVLNNYSTDRYGRYTNQSIHELKEAVKNGKYPPNETWWDHTFELELSNLQALRIIIKRYDISSIVICSTWRHVFSIPDFELLLISKGYPDIANLIVAKTGLCSKEDKEKFGMTKRERTIEIANYVLGSYKGYEQNWYVLDDDVTEDDINSIKSIQGVKSLYFEFKATLQEYKRKEAALLEEIATGEVVIHPLEKDKEDDHEIMKEIKGRYKIIKSAILDPNLHLKDMFYTVSRELKRIEIAAMIALREEREQEYVGRNKRRDTQSAK